MSADNAENAASAGNERFVRRSSWGCGNIQNLVHRLLYNDDTVAFKMGRLRGARREHI
jgi:hypothetical protein